MVCHFEKRIRELGKERVGKGYDAGILRQRIMVLRFLYSLLLQQKLWETGEHLPHITHSGQSPKVALPTSMPSPKQPCSSLAPTPSHSRHTLSRQLPKLVQPMAPGPFLLPQLQSFPQTCSLPTTSHSNFHSHTGCFCHILRTTNPPASLPSHIHLGPYPSES